MCVCVFVWLWSGRSDGVVVGWVVGAWGGRRRKSECISTVQEYYSKKIYHFILDWALTPSGRVGVQAPKSPGLNFLLWEDAFFRGARGREAGKGVPFTGQYTPQKEASPGGLMRRQSERMCYLRKEGLGWVGKVVGVSDHDTKTVVDQNCCDWRICVFRAKKGKGSKKRRITQVGVRFFQVKIVCGVRWMQPGRRPQKKLANEGKAIEAVSLILLFTDQFHKFAYSKDKISHVLLPTPASGWIAAFIGLTSRQQRPQARICL